jgi:IS30 family transposase
MHKAEGRDQIDDAISIKDRSALVEYRAIPFHRQTDLPLESDQSAIATLGERQSRFTVL